LRATGLPLSLIPVEDMACFRKLDQTPTISISATFSRGLRTMVHQESKFIEREPARMPGITRQPRRIVSISTMAQPAVESVRNPPRRLVARSTPRTAPAKSSSQINAVTYNSLPPNEMTIMTTMATSLQGVQW
jgi:hypothetical protein